MRDTIFNQIVAGEAPAHKIYEDDDHLAFLDIFPAYEGQALVIPKEDPGDYIFDMPEADYTALMQKTKKVANVLKDALNAERVVMIIEGLEVPYVHVRLYPLKDESQGFNPSGTSRADDEELAELAEEIRESY